MALVTIWFRYGTQSVEELDTASSWKEARKLLAEYQLAYSSDPNSKLWIGRKKDEPK